MLEAGGLHLERPDPVAGRDDDVVGSAFVPDIAVLVLARGVLSVKPLSAEDLDAFLWPLPVPEGVVRIRTSAEADLAALAGRDGILVFIQDLDVPARHRLAHGALAHVHERVVRNERVRLRQAVVVEHRDSELVAEPTYRLGVQWFARGANAAEDLRIASACVSDRHHRAHRCRSREHVRNALAAEEVELLVRVEPALTLIDALDRAETPRPEKWRDSRSPRPLAHAMETLAVLDFVAVEKFLVAKDVAMRMDNAFRESRCARCVIELRRIIGGGVAEDRICRRAYERFFVHKQEPGCRSAEAAGIHRIGDDELRARIVESVPDRIVAIQHRHRKQDRAQLPGTEEDRSGLGGWRQDDRHAVSTLDPVRSERVCSLVREILKLTPDELPVRPVEALPHHRRLVTRMLVADVGSEVVARRHNPAMSRTGFLV